MPNMKKTQTITHKKTRNIVLKLWFRNVCGTRQNICHPFTPTGMKVTQYALP